MSRHSEWRRREVPWLTPCGVFSSRRASSNLGLAAGEMNSAQRGIASAPEKKSFRDGGRRGTCGILTTDGPVPVTDQRRLAARLGASRKGFGGSVFVGASSLNGRNCPAKTHGVFSCRQRLEGENAPVGVDVLDAVLPFSESGCCSRDDRSVDPGTRGNKQRKGACPTDCLAFPFPSEWRYISILQ